MLCCKGGRVGYSIDRTGKSKCKGSLRSAASYYNDSMCVRTKYMYILYICCIFVIPSREPYGSIFNYRSGRTECFSWEEVIDFLSFS